MELAEITDFVATTKLELRPYQGRIIKRAVESFLDKGMRSVLIESATGSGKTAIMLSIIRILQTKLGLRVGWVAMRRNLLTQAAAENQAKGINADVTFISMFDRNPPTGFDLLVCDEAQHQAASSMVHLDSLIRPRYLLGATATPFRTDSVRLSFDTIIKDCGIGRLIEDGYLSQYHHFTIPTYSVETSTGLYLREPERWGKSIFFYHTLDQCFAARDRLQAGGIACDVVTGSSDREAQLDAFREGKLQALINCMVLTEGMDVPSLQTVFCRPSCKSVTIQMAGRAFRKHPDVPVKQVVQCKRTKWPFIRTARPEMQYTLLDDGTWAALTVSRDIGRLTTKMVCALATLRPQLPGFIKDKTNAARSLRAHRRQRQRAGN